MAENLLAVRLARIRWRYADGDLEGARVLERRLADAARSPRQVIPYSDLASGIDLRPTSLNVALPYRIDVARWTPVDRAVIGDYLGCISSHSYRRADFLAGAVVVDRNELKPSLPFFQWMRDLGALPELQEDAIDAFWLEHLRRARTWYSAHPGEILTP